MGVHDRIDTYTTSYRKLRQAFIKKEPIKEEHKDVTTLTIGNVDIRRKESFLEYIQGGL